MRSLVAYIGLGSNLADPRQQVCDAITALQHLPHCRLIASSRLYRSKPMGPAEQPDYINAVAALETSLSPFALLDGLQAIEQQQGRERDGQRWGPRTLDLDLLLYGEQQIDDARLKVPHAGLAVRNFVLYPLQEIAADDLIVPGLGRLKTLVQNCSQNGLELLHRC